MAVPQRDVLLIPYSTNWNTRIVASPVTYALSAGQVTQFTTLYTPYNTAATECAEPGQKSKSLLALRNSAKAALMPYFRELYALIKANSQVTDQAKVDLGINLRNPPSPRPVPSTAPVITAKQVYGHNITLRIRDAGGRRGRALYAEGCTLFSFVGETAPGAGSPDWKCEGNVTKDTIIVQIPEEHPAGAKVYFTGFWYSQRGLSGPSCTPVVSMVGPEGAMPLAG